MPMPAPQLQNQKNTEKRRYPRKQWMPKVSGIFVSDTGKRVVEQLQGVDISEGGMGIAGRQVYPVGTQLIVNIPEHKGRSRCVHAKVVRCWEENSQVRMGLEFNDSPNDTVLDTNTLLSRAA